MATSAFFLTLNIILFSFISLSSSSKPLFFPLTHSLSTTFNSTHLLLKSTTTNSAARFRRRHRNNPHVSLPLSPGSDYTLSFSLSSQTISLYMDTGSDVVWLPCNPFSCILCDAKFTPSSVPYPSPLNLSSTATAVDCQSPSCSAVHSHLPSSDLCAISRCPLDSIEMSECQKFSCPNFYYAYGDGSLVARLFTDTLVAPPLVIRNFTFGCAHTALAEPIGVAGFGRGLLSLPAQLSSFSPPLGNQFSYCLVSHSFDADEIRRPSPLILGRYSAAKAERIDGGDFVYTPMLENPKHPYYYYVGLEGISVGSRRIPAPENLRRIDGGGNGGMVVDSGTTYTMLPAEFYDSVVTEFDRRFKRVFKRAGPVEDRTGLSPCYYLGDGNSRDSGRITRMVPRLVLHFGGNSSVVMPRRNYFYQFLDGGDGKEEKRMVGCMMVMNGGDFPDSGGPAGLLGNYQQQGLQVMYDLEKMRVGFARRKCASLWEDLNRD